MKMLKTIVVGLSVAVAVAPQAQGINVDSLKDSFKNFGQSVVDRAYENPVLATMAAVSILAATGVSLKALYNNYQQGPRQNELEKKTEVTKITSKQLAQDAAHKNEIIVLLNDLVNNDAKEKFVAVVGNIKALNSLSKEQKGVILLGNENSAGIHKVNSALKTYNEKKDVKSYDALVDDVYAFCDLLGLDKMQVDVKDRHTQPSIGEVVSEKASDAVSAVTQKTNKVVSSVVKTVNAKIPTTDDAKTAGLNLLAYAQAGLGYATSWFRK